MRKDIKKIAVIGPNADHALNQLGDYTAKVVLQDIVTVLDGIEAKVSPRTEVDYINGYICDRGREHGVPTPVNDAVRDMGHEIEAGKRQMSLKNVEDPVRRLCIPRLVW